MEFTNLFTGSDNLFKFLFLAGLFMLVLSLVYPLEKRNELEIEIINVNRETDILNNQVSTLKTQTLSLSKNVTKIERDLDSLSRMRKIEKSTIRRESIEEQIEKIKNAFNLEFSKLDKNQAEIKTKSIVVNYDKSRIQLLKEQQKEYATYFFVFKWAGILLIIVGIIGWHKSHRRNERIKDKQINTP